MITLFFTSFVSSRMRPLLSCTISWQSFTGFLEKSSWLQALLIRYFLFPCPSTGSSFCAFKIAGAQNSPVAVIPELRKNVLLFIEVFFKRLGLLLLFLQHL